MKARQARKKRKTCKAREKGNAITTQKDEDTKAREARNLARSQKIFKESSVKKYFCSTEDLVEMTKVEYAMGILRVFTKVLRATSFTNIYLNLSTKHFLF